MIRLVDPCRVERTTEMHPAGLSKMLVKLDLDAVCAHRPDLDGTPMAQEKAIQILSALGCHRIGALWVCDEHAFAYLHEDEIEAMYPWPAARNAVLAASA